MMFIFGSCRYTKKLFVDGVVNVVMVSEHVPMFYENYMLVANLRVNKVWLVRPVYFCNHTVLKKMVDGLVVVQLYETG